MKNRRGLDGISQGEENKSNEPQLDRGDHLPYSCYSTPAVLSTALGADPLRGAFYLELRPFSGAYFGLLLRYVSCARDCERFRPPLDLRPRLAILLYSIWQASARCRKPARGQKTLPTR